MTPDAELLRRFARTNAEDAFAELVKRHVNLVYSAALRRVGGDAHLAQDVAQTVFTDLARKAGPLARRQTDMCVAQAVPVHGTNANVGVNLDLTPIFSTNASAFDLHLVAELSQLTGDPAQPDLQTVQITNRAALSPGQTAVLAKEIPKDGWLPQATNIPAGPRSLLVFVTPQVVDARGKPVNFPPSNQ
jgi:hypothetical protein